MDVTLVHFLVRNGVDPPSEKGVLRGVTEVHFKHDNFVNYYQHTVYHAMEDADKGICLAKVNFVWIICIAIK